MKARLGACLLLLTFVGRSRPARADVVYPPPSVSVNGLFSGADSFEDNAYIGTPAGIHELKAIQVGDQVYAYYRTYQDVGPAYGSKCTLPAAIGLAISDDGGATFTLYNGGDPVLSKGSPGDWDQCYAIAPSVTQGSDGTYYMVYEGDDGSGHRTNGDIGWATSTDGINWTKQGALLSHDGGWEAGNIGTPSIHNFNDYWYVFYHGDDGQGYECRGFASGSDLGSLGKHGDPVLCPTSDSWDGAVIGRGDIYYDGSSYYMVYEGNSYDGDGGAWGWGVAESLDLVNWTKYAGNPIRQSPSGFGADIPSWFVTSDNAYVYYRAVDAGNTTERDLLVSGGGLPEGSYEQTCSECTISGTTLSCSCLSESSQWISSLLDDSTCLSGSDISNNNGTLQCATSGGSTVSTLPSGSYSQTCSACGFLGTTLSCSCLSEAGQNVSTSLDDSTCNSGSDISNNNGTLQCATSGGSTLSTLPSGSYSQTCSACGFSGTTLSCSCLSEAGQNVSTSLDDSTCNSGSDISNNNGYLQCATGG